MRGTFSFATVSVLSSLTSLVHAQQFEGNNITNSLPDVSGAELAYWKITDKKDRNFTLLNYFSLDSDFNRLTKSNVQRAVIVVHGLQRDPDNYITQIMQSLSAVPSDAGPDASNTQLMTPYFPNGADKDYAYPWNESAAAGEGSYTDALVWEGSGWIGGQNNQYPHGQIATSSFDVIDQIIEYFADDDLYPNLNEIVLAGHSAGAQFVQRYAAVSNDLSDALGDKRLQLYIANPDSWLWLNSSRPAPNSSCTTYDDWRFGLSNYDPTYGKDLVAEGADAVQANYQAHSIAYARGLQDLGDDSNTCEPFTTGDNRNERFYNFINFFPPTCDDSTDESCDTIDYVNTGHNSQEMFSSDAGLQRLFIDNFDGDGGRATDYYCPRQAVGDNPLPDSTCTSTVATPTGTYSGMTYQGCWFDGNDPDDLSYLAYDNSSNSIELCTEVCASDGYSLAGMEYGYRCYCGNGLASEAQKVAEQGCTIACPGNSGEICGAEERISLWGRYVPTAGSDTGNPSIIGDYSYAGCYLDLSPDRSLIGASTTGSNMTNEVCATFCDGYTYFGTEYGDECFCGDSIATGDTEATSTDCDTPCSGNSTESCGAGFRLSLYALTGTNVTVG